MKRFLLALLLASGVTYADTTANLITSPLSPTVPASAPEGYSGGSSVGYNSSTNTYYFGYTQRTIATTIAVNNALQGSGVQVGGVNYGMSYLNGANSYGTLGLTVDVKNSSGNLLHTYSHAFNTQNNNWQTFDQTQMFNSPYEISTLGNASMSITGKDSRFWAGYYGPQVKDPYLKLVYTAEVPVVTTPSFWDDTYVSVPLQFGFPFYGRVFTNSWMHSNGVVSFLDPAVPISDVGYNPGAWAYCCGDRPTTTRPEFQYMIAPLWTDLYPTGDSSFRTEGTSQYQKYFWTNLGEISNTNNKNTFSLELRPSGFIGINYTQINGMQNYWAGTVGNPAAGEINEVFYGVPGINNTTISNWSMQTTPVGDLCLVNPLSSPNCAGYTDAMCSANPLYSTSCSGYAAAYYTQQCSLNSLFDPGCPGYAAAYLEYQCSANPLYSTACQGYEQAYFDQQCSINPLYNSSCPGYEQAYFDQQCSLDGLYSNQCPNYAEAYAKKNILNIGSTTTTTTIVDTTAATPTVSSDGTVKTEVSATGDATVDSVISNNTTSATSATATVQLAPSPTQSSPAQTVGAVVEQKQETKNDSSSSTKENGSGSSGSQSAQSSGDKKEGTKTARQELQEKRVAAAKAKAVEEGKQLAGKVGEAATLEAQVAVQNVLIAAMGYTPGFQTYNVIMPDVPGYKPFTVYKNQKNVDNARMMRGLSGASDRLHEQLVESQYTQR